MTTPLLSRTDWGARPARSTPRTINNEGLTVHYGGNSPWGDTDRSTPEAFATSTDHARCATIFRGWQAYHLDGQRWDDIGYNSGVCPHGYRYEGRGVDRRSAGQGTVAGNNRSCAVVYIAGAGDPVTAEARRAFHDEAARYGKPLRWNHGDWKATACAGPDLRAWQAAGFPAEPSTSTGGPTPAPTPPTAKPESKPAPKGPVVPTFPLPNGWYYGPRSGPRHSVSGFYHRRSNGQPGHDGLVRWQVRMAQRGWRIAVDGLYGPQTAGVARSFQREKGLGVDALIGPATWAAAWTAPVT